MSTSTTPSELGEDRRLVETTATGRAEAWLWWTHVPTLPGETLGAIGHFSADSADATAAVLKRACAELRAQGCTRAIGPMDGNTWRKYRFVTEAGDTPPFFLEPINPSEWPAWWQASGFAPLAEYYSSAGADLSVRDPRLDSVAARMRDAGIAIRPLDPTQFGAELDRIYDVSVVSFQSNYLYTPLPRVAFTGQYRAIEKLVRPELVLLAEQAGKPIGYVFALPDLAEAQRGEPIRTVIVKTLAVLPGRSGAGLGALLLAEAHEAAHRLGYSRVIHALMHASNRSRNLSAHYARTIRRYTLFSRALVP